MPLIKGGRCFCHFLHYRHGPLLLPHDSKKAAGGGITLYTVVKDEDDIESLKGEKDGQQ